MRQLLNARDQVYETEYSVAVVESRVVVVTNVPLVEAAAGRMVEPILSWSTASLATWETELVWFIYEYGLVYLQAHSL